MNKKLKEKIQESLTTVLPITAVVLLLSIFLLPIDVGTVALFLTGAFFLIVGMGFFQLGAEITIMPLGEGVGQHLVKTKNLVITIVVCFVVGVIITVAEPDLQVLSNQVPSIPNAVLVWTVAFGVGIFTIAAVLRILLNISLLKILIVLYPVLFLVSFLVPADFTAIAFDSGGVTTGPMTVPFIMALGIGFSSARCDKNSDSDSFGLVALCSIGPILMVLLLSLFFHPGDASYDMAEIVELFTMQDVVHQFIIALPAQLREVSVIIFPILLVFVIFQLCTKQYRRKQILRLLVGLLYTLIGTTLFLTGVNTGFAPVGTLLGAELAGSPFKWMLVPVGALVGFYIVKAEPAVQVLNNQVEDITNGTVSRNSMNRCLSIGVSAAVALAMVRILTGVNIYWILIPGYILALCMAKRVEPIFVGIAFDSGGVASGPMTSTFLLPMAIGACVGVGGNITTDAFGVVALVALAPIIAIQATGLVYAYKAKRLPVTAVSEEIDYEFVDLEEE